MFRHGLLCAAAWLLAAANAHAQSPAADPRVLGARLDSLMPAYRAARDAMLRSDSIRQAQRADSAKVPLDTVTRAPIILVMRPEDRASIEAALARVWPARASLATAIDTPAAVVLVANGEDVLYFDQLAKRPHHSRVNLQRSGLREDPEATLLYAIDLALFDVLPVEVREWLGENTFARNDEFAFAYRELATSQSPLVRRCFAGDAAACLGALGLGAQGQPAHWYTPEQLRNLVIFRRGPAPDGSTKKQRCLHAGDADACLAYLQRVGGIPKPLSAGARATFLMLVLQTGGQGSMERLRHGATIEERLENAAGTSLHAVADAWQRRVRAERPPVYAGADRVHLVTMLWILLVLGIAMRSTRWRLQ